MLAADRNSRAKSRSLTASSEFAAGSVNPSSSAVRCRSIGNPVPASAPAPSGDTFRRASESSSRRWSRVNISK